MILDNNGGSKGGGGGGGWGWVVGDPSAQIKKCIDICNKLLFYIEKSEEQNASNH